MSLGCIFLTMAIWKSFFFMRTFNKTPMASGTLETGAKIQYLRMLVRGESLRQFDLFYDNKESTDTLIVE